MTAFIITLGISRGMGTPEPTPTPTAPPESATTGTTTNPTPTPTPPIGALWIRELTVTGLPDEVWPRMIVSPSHVTFRINGVFANDFEFGGTVGSLINLLHITVRHHFRAGNNEIMMFINMTGENDEPWAGERSWTLNIQNPANPPSLQGGTINIAQE